MAEGVGKGLQCSFSPMVLNYVFVFYLVCDLYGWALLFFVGLLFAGYVLVFLEILYPLFPCSTPGTILIIYIILSLAVQKKKQCY